jgi:tetratricopeptide (TPR) repeat protein
VQGREQLEVYHDRIRAAVVRTLEAEQVESLHLELAAGLERIGCLDPEALATHYAAAGCRDKGAVFAAQAAQRAVTALAFNKAADFYRIACENETDPQQRALLSRGIGEALSSAGRGEEAANAFMAAAEYASGRDRLQILSLAAGQFIRTGEMRRGISLLTEVLRQAKLWLPASLGGRLFILGVFRLRIRLRGLSHEERAVQEINAEELFRLELAGRAALSLALSDPVASAVFSSQYLLMALEAGERTGLSMAFAGAAIHHCLSRGRRSEFVTLDYLSRARQLAEDSGDSRASAFVRLMSGLVHYLRGNWKEASIDCDAAASAFRETCTGVVWELTLAMMFSLIALSNRGDWAEVRRRIPALIRDAQMRGDLQQWLSRILACAFASYLAAGESDEAIRLLEAASGAWPNETYNIQTCNSLLGTIGAYLYLGKPQEAWVRLQKQWPDLKRSRLLYLPTTSAFVYFARGRLAIAMAALEDREGARPYLRMARRDAHSIESRGPKWSYGFAYLLRSGIASFGADLRAVQNHLAAAEARFRAADLQSFRMATIYRMVQLEPDRAATVRSEISAWIEREGICEPERVMAMLAPGRWNLTLVRSRREA